MANAATVTGPGGPGVTQRIMREALDSYAEGARWQDRIVTATAGARESLIAQARAAMNSRAADYVRRQLGWFRRLLADIGIINIAGYTATTIEGRRGLRAVLGFAYRVLRLPFRLVGKPLGWLLRHTGRPGRWVQNNAIVVFCIARDKTVGGYNAAEVWLEEHDNDGWVRWARAFFHWRIVSRLVDRFAPRWFPGWARFVVKLAVPSFTYNRNGEQVGKTVVSTAAESVLDGLERAASSLHEGMAAVGQEIPVTRIQLRDGTGKLIAADVIDIGEDTYVRVAGEKRFVKGTAPSGYERVTLTEVASDTLANGGGVPVPGNREARREAERHDGPVK